jgi:hypothetical protein
MENTKYNGWTNYATWRINLEFFDDGATEYYQTSDEMKSYVTDYLEEQASGVALSYALAFIDNVNWHEIAENHKEA